MARPKKEIDEDVVFDLASKGWTNKEIAAELQCSHDTIERRFAGTIKEGHAIRNGKLRSKQFEVAMEGNPTMLIWLGKQLLDQKDRVEQSGEVTVRDASEYAKRVMNERINGRVDGHPEGAGTGTGN